MLGRIGKLFQFQRISDEEFRRQRDQVIREVPAPVFWMIGKTGSGKTSVVQYLTGAERAKIGNGYRPQTASSQQFDFPAADNALVRFLDTRGLGECRYDPTEDISAFHDSTHLLIVTVRVMDHAVADVVAPLREIRKAQPKRPVVLLLTCLHEAYPQQQHPDPDPFDQSLTPDSLPNELRDSIRWQTERFQGLEAISKSGFRGKSRRSSKASSWSGNRTLVDAIVPIDLTPVAEGFAEPNFGGRRLKSALFALLPAAHRQTLASLDAAMRTLEDLNERRAMPYVIGYSSMAATAAAVPVPWVDIPFVAAIQSHLVHQLAGIYGQSLGAEGFIKVAGAIGARLLTRLVLRSLTKFIPVVGAAANAALAYVYTYALGKACCWYFGQVRQGNVPDQSEIEQVWRDQLEQAAALWNRQKPEKVDS